MIVLGITGAIGHGKSTVAEILTKLEPNSRIFETSEVISEVATELCEYYDATISVDDSESINNWLSQLPHILSKVLNRHFNGTLFTIAPSKIGNPVAEYKKLWEFIEWANRKPGHVHTLITQENKTDYRPLLQWIGGYCVENISPTIWNTELLNRANKAKMNGYNLAILGGIRFNDEAVNIRKNGGLVVEVIRPTFDTQDSEDPTERQRSLIKPDFVIVNDGTISELITKVEKLYKKIKTADSKA